MPRLLAVDGNSLGHRGFHSLQGGTDSPANAVTGAVVSMLASACGHGPYDGMLVAFDHPANRRKTAHPEYKANRPPTPQPLRDALDALRLHLDACGFDVVEQEGLEADDLLAAAVDDCLVRGWRCDLLSSDRDLTALVDEGVRLLRPRATFADLVIEDVDVVRHRYGVEPWQYTELAALRGDPSDGLEGAHGIGTKTAAKLLRQHGSISTIYQRLADVPPKIEASLREARDRVERNLVLMAPIPHVTVDTGTAVARGIDAARIDAALAPLGLERAARRMRRLLTSPVPPTPPRAPPPTSPDEPDVAALGTRGQIGSTTSGEGDRRSVGAADGATQDVGQQPPRPVGEQTSLF